ncbi:MAG: energy transducer TonB, partial [Chlorobi bacterium]|nr:energy transducer TonB [Chlorobiota bacterium]
QEFRALKPTGKLFYYSAAASILILFGVLSYLNFPAHKLTMETAGNIIKENMELPALPVPPLGKGKKTDRAREAKKQKPIQSTGEKLQHITVNFSEIGDEAFFDEDLEISMVESEKQSKGEKGINGTNSPEGFLMDMVVISGSSTKSGPSAPVQFLQYDEEADSGEKGNGKDEEAVFAIVETMPRFPGGETGLRKYLQQNLSYPAKARKAGIEGKIYVSFVVNSAGKATDVKIVKGIGEACDEQALRAINDMPFWKPATQQGRPVSVRFVVPVYFKLN